MRRYITIATSILLALLASSSWAASTECPDHFAGGEAPDVVAPPPEVHLQPLCFQEFGVLHSSATRTPVWSAEHLTEARIAAASQMKRKNPFHAEQALPPEDRAELADYRASGYDRGHMAPNGDMPDANSQRESFSLANMIPQDADNNRGLWAHIEDAVRALTRTDGEVYVVTGPIFSPEGERLNDRVGVPIKIYKAVYDPKLKAAGVYLTDNAPGNDWQVISVSELKTLAGVDAFPKLAPEIREHAMALPKPLTISRHRFISEDKE